MIKSTKEADQFPLKQEGVSNEKAKALSSSSSQWLKLKDPRIVRVSRAFGGKDRHSKVCTIRGLRDRRVRLSVPTAIHLYDLQDRLGLSQPSKVVDWLLSAAKHEIDELPPLPIPPGNFTLGYPSLVTSNNNEVISTTSEGSGQNTIWKQKSKEVSRDKEILINRSADDNNNNKHVLPNNNHPSFLGLLNTMPFGNYQWEPNNSSIDVCQLGNHGFVNQNVVPFPSSSGNSTSQILVCPPSGATTQQYFPSNVATMEMNPRQMINHYQMMSSSSQNVLMTPSHHLKSHSGKVPFSLDRPKQLFHSPNSSESHSQNDQDFASK